jgi:hypothetical protein
MTRLLPLLAALAAAGCNASPASLGITGPGAPPKPPPIIDDSTILAPGTPDPGNGYGPSVGPTPSSASPSGGGQYFNYN